MVRLAFRIADIRRAFVSVGGSIVFDDGFYGLSSRVTDDTPTIAHLRVIHDRPEQFDVFHANRILTRPMRALRVHTAIRIGKAPRTCARFIAPYLRRYATCRTGFGRRVAWRSIRAQIKRAIVSIHGQIRVFRYRRLGAVAVAHSAQAIATIQVAHERACGFGILNRAITLDA
jgi:hypothetical protein